jgi:hypothetical protein
MILLEIGNFYLTVISVLLTSIMGGLITLIGNVSGVKNELKNLRIELTKEITNFDNLRITCNDKHKEINNILNDHENRLKKNELDINTLNTYKNK